MVRKIIFIILMAFSFCSYSQCESKKVETDSCGVMVLLTFDDFTEFYVAKRDLEKIAIEFPKLKKKLKTAEKSLKKEAELNEIKIKASKQTVKRLKQLLSELEIEKIKTDNELLLQKKRSKSLFIVSLVQGIVLVITLTLIIAK